jgi:hypothetical protein
MACRVEQRDRARAAAEQAGAFPRTEGVDIYAPQAGVRQRWTVTVVVQDERAIPNAVTAALCEHGLDVFDVTRQGRRHYVVRAEVA